MHAFVRLSRFLLLLTFSVAPAFALEMPAGIGQQAASVAVPQGVAAPTVQQAILLAGTGRGWTVRARDDSQVVLFLEHGGWRSTLTVRYDASQVTIFSNSAKLDGKGRPKKIAVPDSWVHFLSVDITKRLGEAAYGK